MTERIPFSVRQFSKTFFSEQRNEIANQIWQLRHLYSKSKSDLIREAGRRETAAKLIEFYHDQEEEFRKRDLSEIARQYNVVFIHGIMLDRTPNPNSIVKEGTSWKRKLEIVLALQPTLSTSTVQAGDTDREMWSRMGIILNGGFVLNASPGDGNSRAQAPKLRKYHPIDETQDTGQATMTAITKRDQSEERIRKELYDYNEFVVAEPQVAGFYICADRIPEAATDERFTIKDAAPFAELVPFIRSLGLELYIFKSGLLYRGDYDKEHNVLVLCEPVSTQEILQKAYYLPEEKRKEIIEGLIHDSPFKLPTSEKAEMITPLGLIFGVQGGNPENAIGLGALLDMNARFEGEKFYVELNSTSNNFPKDLPAVIIEHPDEDGYGYLSEGVGRAELLATVRGPEDKVEYALVGNEVYQRSKDYDKKEFDKRYISAIFISSYKGQNTLLTLGRNDRFLFDVCLKNNSDYLREMEKIAQMGSRFLEVPFLLRLDSKQAQVFIAKIRKFAFHIYGFGKQAEKWEDHKTKTKAFEIASKIVPIEEYRRIIKERTGHDGRFQLTREDLGLKS